MPKKTRATKITDIRAEKAWLKKTRPSAYALESRDRKKTFLIVCEGQTEEQYFKSFPVVSASVKPVPLGCSKTALVECTKQIVAEDNYDEVWCVFDMDVKGDIVGQKEDYNLAIRSALKAGFKCAYSNDAFELWFALHYNYYDQQQHRSFYYEKLSDFWNINYEKHGKLLSFSKTIYTKLLEGGADQLEAIRRAKQLHNKYSSENYHEHNPVTLVYKLVLKLNQYLRT
ncbi:RloB family protein [Pedobacter psychroterrae]|uniref:RloB domain-containing protein n=1 Tax=Pedobacter psychroterrae TaxID=2530453 RepID=A0A4R0NAS1_9SPHI|nr:RloB family protein [Pedobacter psychroterrae]TCC97340.1 RloB domain-containing protein [Pedobacter psychroterrae]